MVCVRKGVAAFVLLLALLVLPTEQRGALFADEVRGATEEFTLIRTISSEEQTIEVIDFADAHVSDPDGVIADIPGTFTMNSGTSSLLTGTVRTSLEADTWNINTEFFDLYGASVVHEYTGDVTFTVEDDGEEVASSGFITSSALHSNWHGQSTEVDGVWGVEIVGQAVFVEAASAINVLTDELSLDGKEDVHFESSAGNLFFDSRTAVTMRAPLIDLNAHTFSQLASKEDLTMRAAGAVHGRAGTIAINAIEDAAFRSEKQSVSVTAATTVDLEAEGAMTIDAETINVRTEEDLESGVTFKGENINFSGDSMVLKVPNFELSTPSDFTLKYETLVLAAKFELSVGSPLAQGGTGVNSDQVDLGGGDRVSLESEQDLFINSPLVAFSANSDDVADPGTLVVTAGSNMLLDAPELDVELLGASFTSQGIANYLKIDSSDMRLNVQDLLELEGRHVSMSSGNATFNVDDSFTLWAGLLSAEHQIVTVTQRDGTYPDVRFDAARDLNIRSDTFIAEASAALNIEAGGYVEMLGSLHATARDGFAATSDGSVRIDGSVMAVEGFDLAALVAQRRNAIEGNLIIDTEGAYTAEVALDYVVDETKHVTVEVSEAAGDTLVYAGGHFSLESGQVVEVSATNLKVHADSGSWFLDTRTDAAPGSLEAMSFSAAARIDLTADGAVLFDSSELIHVSTGAMNLTALGPGTLRGDQNVVVNTFGGNFSVVAAQNARFYSDGLMSTVVVGSMDADADTISMQAFGNVEWTTGSTLVESGGHMGVGGASMFLYTEEDMVFRTLRSATLTATTPGETIFALGGSVSVSAPQVVGEEAVSIRGSVGLGSTLTIDAVAKATVNGGETISLSSDFVWGVGEQELYIHTNLGGVSMDGSGVDALPSSLVSTDEEMRLYATGGVFFISDLDMRLSANHSVEALTDELTLEGVDHVTLRGYGVDIEAFDEVSGEIAVTSGGALSMEALGGKLLFDSARDIVTDTGGALHMRATVENFRIAPVDGNEANVRFETRGALDIEGAKGVRVSTFGEDADILIKLGDVVSVVSDEGGVVLRGEALVHGEKASDRVVDEPGVLVDTYDNGGNVFFKADRAEVVFEGTEGVTVEAFYSVGEVDGLYGVDVTAGTNITLESLERFVEINGGRGVLIKAGQEPDTGAIEVDALKRGTFVAEDRISIRSEGEVEGWGVLVRSEAGHVRFSTSNGKDIQADANFDMYFNVSGSWFAEATGDVDVITYAGPTELHGAAGITVATEGGPIVFDTRSGSGGVVLFESTDSSIESDSGGDLLMGAESSIAMRAGRNFDVDVGGRIDIAAESTESTIHLLAGGSLHVDSNDEEAGVTFEAANNMEVSASNLVSINSVNEFNVGQETRPLVRVNAGGSATQEGFSVLSEGTIEVGSQRVLSVAVEQSVDVDADSRVDVRAGGRMLVKSTAGDIKWEALRGSVNFTSRRGNVQGEQSVEMRAGEKLFLTQQGTAPGNSITIDAYRTLFETVSLDAAVGEMDVVASDTVDLVVEGTGVVRTSATLGGSLRVESADDFTALSAGEMRFDTVSRRGPQVFETVGSGSSVLLETLQANSHVLFDASGQASAGANAISFTSFESGGTGVVIESVTNPNNEKAAESDVEIYASRRGLLRTDGRLEVSVARDALLTASDVDDEGVGGSISISSSRHFELDAAAGAQLSTEADEGGDILLYAFDDMFFGTEEGSSGRLNIVGEQNLFMAAQEDVVMQGDGLWSGGSGGEAFFIAHGQLPGIEEEAVVLEAYSLHFESQRGTILISAYEDMYFVGEGELAGVGNVNGEIVSFAGDLRLEAESGTLALEAKSGPLQVANYGGTRVEAAQRFGIVANGLELNKLWAARLQSDTLIGMEGTYWEATAESVDLRTGQASWLAETTFSISSLDDFNAESAGATFIDSRDLALTATNNGVDLASAGSVAIGADTLGFITSKLTMRTPADAADSNVAAWAAGNLNVAATHVSMRATGPEGANGLMHATGGRMRITGDTQGAVGLRAVAEEGDVLIRSAELRPVVFQALENTLFSFSGAFDATGSGTEPNQPVGASIAAENVRISSERDELLFSGDHVLFSGDNFEFGLGNANVDVEGDLTVAAADELVLRGEPLVLSAGSGVINNPATSIGAGTITIRSVDRDEFSVSEQSGVLFHPEGTSGTPETWVTDIATGSRLLIPFTTTNIADGDECPVNRELVYTVGNEMDIGRLCVCNGYNPSGTLRMTPIWVCVEFPLENRVP